MIELPECYVLAEQINDTLIGKTICNAYADTHPHKFAWYSENPEGYGDLLSGRKIIKANPGTGHTCGGNTEILCDDILLVLSTPIKYHPVGSKLPKKHQLLLEFDDGSHLSCTVQMWGAMFCYPEGDMRLPEKYKVHQSPSPLEDEFDMKYFETLLSGVKKNISAKAFLATEQRIPGLGNGVLQDILFNARIHPKTKLSSLKDHDFETMYHSIKSTLYEMKINGGRDTEKDLFGMAGGYKTVLSKKTLEEPCYVCGSYISRQAYLGGNIYFCPECQKEQ